LFLLLLNTTQTPAHFFFSAEEQQRQQKRRAEENKARHKRVLFTGSGARKKRTKITDNFLVTVWRSG
jgi:hypothetical protein